MRISKYKNIFVKDFAQNWPEEAFVGKKVYNSRGNLFPIILMVRKIVWTLYENELKNLK